MYMKTLTLALVLGASTAVATPVLADTWTVDAGQSRLGFEVKQGDGTLKGFFDTWTAEIDFDPEAPEAARISAEINAGSASTGNPQFDATLPASEWFDVSTFPVASFETESVTRAEGNSYKADGTLTIKGIAQPVALDFTLDIDGDTAKATGTATVKRTEYELGAGVGTDTVGDAVTVTLDLTANR